MDAAQPATTPPAPQPTPRPWGPVGSLLWAAAALAVQYVVIFVVAMILGAMQPGGLAALGSLSPVSPLVWIGTVVALPFQLAVLERATRARGGFAAYLGLTWPKRTQLLQGLAVTIALLVASDTLTVALGRQVVPDFMREAYTAARAAQALPILILAVVVAAPVWEEFLFRGFLYRGLSETRLGAAGAVVVISLVWAIVHVQYDWYGIVQIFVIGLVFGWLRVRSGSTWLTTALHGLANLVATGQAFMKIEGYI